MHGILEQELQLTIFQQNQFTTCFAKVLFEAYTQARRNPLQN